MQVLQLFLCLLFLTKMYIAALVFELYNSILTNKIHYTYHKMKAANETNKNERVWGGGALEFGLTELCFPPGLVSMNYRLFFVSRQHYCIILVASLKKVYSRILGRVVTISQLGTYHNILCLSTQNFD